MRKQILAIDFDGTIVTHAYPETGTPIFLAIETLQDLMKDYSLIMWTCREGKCLERAMNYCNERGVHFDAYNCNDGRIHEWSGSRKIYADSYIDDKNFQYMSGEGNPIVDWRMIRKTYLKEEFAFLLDDKQYKQFIAWRRMLAPEQISFIKHTCEYNETSPIQETHTFTTNDPAITLTIK